MKKTLELAWGVIRRPAPTFRRIKEEKPLGRGIFIVFLFLFIMLYISFLRGSGESIGVILSIPLVYLIIMAYSGLFNFMARLLKTKSEYKSLLISNFFISGVIGSIKYLVRTGLSFTKHPPIATVCGPGGCHAVDVSLFSQFTLASLCKILFLAWAVFLLIVALREIYRLSTSKSIVVLCLTMLLILPFFVVTVPNLYSASLPICIVILALLICVTLTLIFRKILLGKLFRQKVLYSLSIFGALFIALATIANLNTIVIPNRIVNKYCVIPEEIASDGGEYIYVTSWIFDNIYKVDSEGRFLAKFTGYRLKKIKVDEKGIVYVFCQGTEDEKYWKVQKFTPEEKFIADVFLKPPKVTIYTKDFDVDSNGNIYVLANLATYGKADYKLHKFNAKGEFLLVFGESGEGVREFCIPQAMAVDQEGNIYVVSMYKIQKFNSDGQFIKVFKGQEEKDIKYCGIMPRDIEVDKKGNIYISTMLGFEWTKKKKVGVWTIKKFDSHGRPLMNLKLSKEEEGIVHPGQIAIDREGNIYVADGRNYKIRIFSTEGKFLRDIQHNPFMIKWYKESFLGRYWRKVFRWSQL